MGKATQFEFVNHDSHHFSVKSKKNPFNDGSTKEKKNPQIDLKAVNMHDIETRYIESFPVREKTSVDHFHDAFKQSLLKTDSLKVVS